MLRSRVFFLLSKLLLCIGGALLRVGICPRAIPWRGHKVPSCCRRWERRRRRLHVEGQRAPPRTRRPVGS